MTDSSTDLSVLFADISDTTGLGETLGAQAARDLVTQCVTMMKEQVKKHEGDVIKTIGDEIMCAFAKPDAALRAVMGIRNAVQERLPRMNPSTPAKLTIRAGLHHGPATRQGDVISGEANRMAGLMAGLARAGQILLTARTLDALSADARALTRLAGPYSIPGTDDEVEAYEVGRPAGQAQAKAEAQPPKQTRESGNGAAAAAQPAAGEAPKAAEAAAQSAAGAAPKAAAAAAQPAAGAATKAAGGEGPHLRLSYRGRDKRISAKETPLVMGRGKTVNVVIADSRASREHARIEHRGGGFFLVDQSRHGTYLMTEEGSRVLCGEEAALTGTGKIAFGRETDEASEVITFTCET